MATLVKFEAFVEAIAEKKIDLSADTFYVQFMNTAPSASADAVAADLPADLSTAGGYTNGGITVGTGSGSSRTGGTFKFVLTDKVFTATGASVGPFRYVALFSNTATNKDLVGYYDYGSSITLADTETFTIDFDGTNGVLVIT